MTRCMRKIKAIRVLRSLGALLLSAPFCVAQVAVQDGVPTDHLGPPACHGASIPAHRPTYEAEKAEQAQGAVLDHALPSAEPLENFGLERIRLADYGDCVGTAGCYWADLDAQYRRAELVLDAAVAGRKAGEKLAMVLDIDETALSSYCEMKREDFGFIPAMSYAWVVSPAAAVAIPGGVRLFNRAKAAGVSVFFITGRPGIPDYANANHPADQTEATARNLELAGYAGWKALLLRNGSENGIPTIEYKAGERQRIADQGYRIVLSVGDQWSDLLGMPQAEFSVKLPNPFYFIP